MFLPSYQITDLHARHKRTLFCRELPLVSLSCPHWHIQDACWWVLPVCREAVHIFWSRIWLTWWNIVQTMKIQPPPPKECSYKLSFLTITVSLKDKCLWSLQFKSYIQLKHNLSEATLVWLIIPIIQKSLNPSKWTEQSSFYHFLFLHQSRFAQQFTKFDLDLYEM